MRLSLLIGTFIVADGSLSQIRASYERDFRFSANFNWR